jgi:RNA polymerase sigma-70 factor (ECF subfamily)
MARVKLFLCSPRQTFEQTRYENPMPSSPINVAAPLKDMADMALHQLASHGGEAAARELMGRYNQRLYRMAWSVLKNPADAEEAVQDAYLKAFTTEAGFDGRSAYSSWLMRIVINQALERRRIAARRAELFEQEGVAAMDDYRSRRAAAPITHGSPEESVARAQFARRLEAAVAQIPDSLRTVFVMRDIEGLSIEETSAVLDTPQATVKTRLSRARKRLQELLEPDLKSALGEAFPFLGERCARLTEAVIQKLAERGPQPL